MKKLMINPRAAAVPQQVGNTGTFDIVEGSWMFEKFKTKAKWLTKVNHFDIEESALMEGLALEALLKIDFAQIARTKEITEGYLYRAIENALTNAAIEVADERRVWGASRKSTDAPTGGDEGSQTLGELVSNHGDLNRQRKSIMIPHPIAYRWTLKRFKKNKAATRKILRRLEADTGIMIDAELTNEAPADEMPSEPVEVLTREEEEKAMAQDDFAGYSDDVNRTVFDSEAFHDKAVAEVGFAADEDAWAPKGVQTSRPASFGSTAEEVYEQVLKVDVALVIQDLEDEKAKAWCRRVLDGWDPVLAYKKLGIKKNDFYKKLRPMLQDAFGHLGYALGGGRN